MIKRIAFFYLLFLLSVINSTAQSNELIGGIQELLVKFQQGQYSEMLKLAENMAALSEKEFGPHDPDHALIVFFVALAQADLGMNDQAEANLGKSLTILKNPKNPLPQHAAYIGFIYMGYGQLYNSKGQYAKSEEFYLKSAKTIEQIQGKDAFYALPINNLGNLAKDQGDYAKAEKYLYEASEIRRRTLGENHVNYGVSLNNLASLYEQMGNYRAAALYYEDSNSIWKKTLGEYHPLLATSYNNYAGLHTKVGNYEEAELLYLQALAVCEKVYGKNHEKYASTLSNLGNLYRLMRKSDQAEEYSSRCLQIRKVLFGEKHIEYAYSLNNLGLVKMDKGNFSEAEKFLLQALSIFTTALGKNHRNVSTCANNLGFIYMKKGDAEKAATYLKQALGISLDRIDYVFPAINDKEKTFFYNTLEKDFEFFNFFASQHYKKNVSLAGDVYNYTIATKALLLNASNKIKKRILTGGDVSLIKLYQDWKEKKNTLAQVWQMTEKEKAASGTNEIALEAEVNNLEKKLSESSELFSSQLDKKRYSWKDIQRKLKPDEAAVEIIRLRKHNFEFSDTAYYAAVIVKPGSAIPEMVVFENGNFLETKLITLYKNAIRVSLEDPKSYAGFWGPIASKLSGIRKVYVSPDGVYNQININSLYNASTKKFVMDEVEVQQVTNTKDILALPGKASVRNAIMLGYPDYKAIPDLKNYPAAGEENEVVADSVKREMATSITPLPGTLSEVNQISAIFRAKNIETQIVTGVEANEGFLKKVQSPSVLHIATHGFFLSDVENKSENMRGGFMGVNPVKAHENPLLRSGILLAGAQQSVAGINTGAEDGILSAYEAMNLNLDNTQLVVLSACETGLGEVRNGEGVYGFQRALIIAGAQAVIMSLWKVSDQVTQELMGAYYKFWMEGQSKRQAFISAQNKIRAEHPEPYFWAPFILIGD